MAKEKKENSSSKSDTSTRKRKAPILTKALLVAFPSALSKAANINITFTSGIGQATVALFRSGNMINMQTTSVSATIFFSNVDRGDVIAINGVATANAIITIDVSTNPGTPTSFGAGPFNIIYGVL